MLFLKSKPEEILYHINQIESLLLSREELDRINKFIFLNEFVENKDVNDFIKDEIIDSKWKEETKKIIDVCNKKIKQNEMLKIHIRECKNFIVFR